MKNLTLKLILAGLILAGSAGVSLAVDSDGGFTGPGTIIEIVFDTGDTGYFEFTGSLLY